VAQGLQEMTVAELRDCLRDRCLPVWGTKTALVMRLAQYFVSNTTGENRA
jgi:hypothetical protein